MIHIKNILKKKKWNQPVVTEPRFLALVNSLLPMDSRLLSYSGGFTVDRNPLFLAGWPAQDPSGAFMVMHLGIWENPEIRDAESVLLKEYLGEMLLERGFPGGASGKEPTAIAGYVGSVPGSGRSPGGGHGNSLQYSCLENPMDRGAWRATVSHRVGHDWSDLAQSYSFESVVLPPPPLPFK